MSRNDSSKPVDVYLDTSVLLDIIDPTCVRHSEAKLLLKIAQSHAASRTLHLFTSVWAIVEAEGVRYGDRCARANSSGVISNSARKQARNALPVNRDELTASKRDLDRLISRLQKRTYFDLIVPGPNDSAEFWPLVREIGHKTAIWPTDSIHLAAAFHSKCTFFVTDDSDFVNKINSSCQTFLRRYYRKSSFFCDGLNSAVSKLKRLGF